MLAPILNWLKKRRENRMMIRQALELRIAENQPEYRISRQQFYDQIFFEIMPRPSWWPADGEHPKNQLPS